MGLGAGRRLARVVDAGIWHACAVKSSRQAPQCVKRLTCADVKRLTYATVCCHDHS